MTQNKKNAFGLLLAFVCSLGAIFFFQNCASHDQDLSKPKEKNTKLDEPQRQEISAGQPSPNRQGNVVAYPSSTATPVTGQTPSAGAPAATPAPASVRNGGDPFNCMVANGSQNFSSLEWCMYQAIRGIFHNTCILKTAEGGTRDFRFEGKPGKCTFAKDDCDGAFGIGEDGFNEWIHSKCTY